MNRPHYLLAAFTLVLLAGFGCRTLVVRDTVSAPLTRAPAFDCPSHLGGRVSPATLPGRIMVVFYRGHW
jgi:hypothetical protein